MLRRFAIFISVFFLFVSHELTLDAQKLFKNSRITSVCYGSGKLKRVYIPPPKEYFDKKGSKGIASVTIYYEGFSQSAITAMERAASILETILPADARVTVSAHWGKLADDNVLGQTSITGFVQGSEINALKPFAIYPISLAEKISGTKFNTDNEGDLYFAINSSINWYLGTDGRPSNQQYDLITVAIHEICHGLGFYDSMYSENNSGGYGVRSIPMIYDTFIEDNAGKKLTDTIVYRNPSAALASQLTGGSLWFNGPLVKTYIQKFPLVYSGRYPTSRVKLYAPAVWDPGSSVSHIEEDEKVTLPQDDLMTPYIGLGEAIHNPGKLTMSILGDLGWINTKIIHLEARDTEEHISQVILNVTVDSDTTYNTNKVGLVYSFDNFKTRDTVLMLPAGRANTFTRTIPITSYETSLKYYFFTEDIFRRLYRSPSLAASQPYDVFIGTDVVKPVIVNTPADYYFETINRITINAAISDNIGVDTAYIEYRKNNGPSKFIGMTGGRVNSYTANINPLPESLNGGDIFQYRIIAVDNSSRHNVAVLPAEGYYSVRIEEIGAPVSSYSTDFSNGANDFFNSGFEITKPPDFNSPGLHTKHPYEFTGDNNKTLHFTAMLRIPVKFDRNGLIISYRELVLVEPGEPDSKYGEPSFYDYVILEVSNDFGVTWFDLIKGYDSRYRPDWETTYNSSINQDGNSTAVGKETMMATHTIYPVSSDSISYGDTLLFRFRLYSDPLAVGWGWAIDDLRIGQLVDNIEEVDNDPVIVYPNPGNGLINISSLNILNNKPVRFSVINSAGVVMRNDYVNVSSTSTIDISDLPAGFYLIRLYTGNSVKIIRYSLIR